MSFADITESAAILGMASLTCNCLALCAHHQRICPQSAIAAQNLRRRDVGQMPLQATGIRQFDSSGGCRDMHLGQPPGQRWCPDRGRVGPPVAVGATRPVITYGYDRWLPSLGRRPVSWCRRGPFERASARSMEAPAGRRGWREAEEAERGCGTGTRPAVPCRERQTSFLGNRWAASPISAL